jgi:hypothetical protein
MVARLLGDLVPRLFSFLDLAKVQVLQPRHLSDGLSANWTVISKRVKQFRWVTKSWSTAINSQQLAGIWRSTMTRMICAWSLVWFGM